MGQIYKIKCDVCEKVFDASRSDVKTCSDACRAKKFRENRKRVRKDEVKKVKHQEVVLKAYERSFVFLLHKLIKEAYDRGETEIEIKLEGGIDLFSHRKDLENEKSFGVYEFSIGRIEGKKDIYSIRKKY